MRYHGSISVYRNSIYRNSIYRNSVYRIFNLSKFNLPNIQFTCSGCGRFMRFLRVRSSQPSDQWLNNGFSYLVMLYIVLNDFFESTRVTHQSMRSLQVRTSEISDLWTNNFLSCLVDLYVVLNVFF